MKTNKKILLSAAVLTTTLLLTGCTATQDIRKDWKSDTKGLPRVVTVYSKTGEVLERYEGNNVRTSVDGSGQVKINLDGKRIQVLNADVVIEEKK